MLLISILTHWVFFPIREDIVASTYKDWSINPKTSISNGPFVLSDYKSNDMIMLKPNKHYWKRNEVKLEAIKILGILRPEVGLTGYEDNQIHVLRSYVTIRLDMRRLHNQFKKCGKTILVLTQFLKKKNGHHI